MKKTLLVLVATLLGCVASASAIDWTVDLQGDPTLNTTWKDATVYSYVLLGSNGTVGTAMSPETFMQNWTSDFGGTSSVMVGEPKTYSGIEAASGAVDGWENNPWGPVYAVYLVLVMVKDGEGIYTSFGEDEGGGLSPYVRGDNGGGTPIELSAASTWTAVTVPEPTVLALLALGVAGLALKRKVA